MRLCDTGALYLHCEECEWAWYDPVGVDDPDRGRLGIDLDGDYASAEQIESMGWKLHATHIASD